MQISMWTSYLIEMLPEKMVKCFADHGWSTLEMSDEHGHDLLKMGDPVKVGEKFRSFAEDLGVTFPQGHFRLCTKGLRPEDMKGRQIADIAPPEKKEFEQSMEDMKRWVDLFGAIGIKAGVLHIGGERLADAGFSQKQIFDRRIEAVAKVADYAKGGPTVICLENLPGEKCGVATAKEIISIINATGKSNIGICLDTGHANITPTDIPTFIRDAGKHLKALHIADNLGTNDDHMLPYGKGNIKWTEAMKALRKIKYNALFNFEVPGENKCPEPVRLAKLDYALKLAKWMTESDGVEPA